jgi:hypothetical protein
MQRVEDNEEIIERVAAIDVGKSELVACVRVPDPESAWPPPAGDHPQFERFLDADARLSSVSESRSRLKIR